MTDDISKVEDRHIAAAFREVIGPNGGRIKNAEICDFVMQRSRELASIESATTPADVDGLTPYARCVAAINSLDDFARMDAGVDPVGPRAAAFSALDDLARQLAEARAEIESWRDDYEALRTAANTKNDALKSRAVKAESQLAEATRRVAEARSTFESCAGMMNSDYVNGYRDALRYIEAALHVDTPTKPRYNCPTEAHDGEE